MLLRKGMGVSMSMSEELDYREDAYQRSIHINDPRDELIKELCERYGYGAVMDSAMRQWIKKDQMGAFYIGGCLGYKDGKSRLPPPPNNATVAGLATTTED